MDSETLFDIMYWVSITMSLILFVISTMAVGKHFADLRYQKAARLNGVRWIQSWINLRTHGNRVLFALVFCATSIMSVIDVDPYWRIAIGRPAFMLVLFVYLTSSVLDWLAEDKQLNVLMKYEEVNNVTNMRLSLHKLNNFLAHYTGLVQLLPKDAQKTAELDELLGDIQVTVQSIQTDVRSMDPSYKAT